jgi:DET1- and DDB1-associated protein 1
VVIAQVLCRIMSAGEFLKNLPTHDVNNFTQIHSASQKPSGRMGGAPTVTTTIRNRANVYVPTKDHPAEQIIVTEKTNILLRYLHQQWDKKAAANAQRKRDAETAAVSGTASAAAGAAAAGTSSGASARKKARLDLLQNGNHAGGSSGQ